MLPKNTSRVPRTRLDITSHPGDGWAAREQAPTVGAEVRSVERMARLVRVLGKVSDGSQFLEVKIVGRGAPPLFAATSNVLQALDSDD